MSSSAPAATLQANVWAKIFVHCAQHVDAPVFGVLLAGEDGNITDAVPLFHSNPMAPMTELAMSMVRVAAFRITRGAKYVLTLRVRGHLTVLCGCLFNVWRRGGVWQVEKHAAACGSTVAGVYCANRHATDVRPSTVISAIAAKIAAKYPAAILCMVCVLCLLVITPSRHHTSARSPGPINLCPITAEC